MTMPECAEEIIPDCSEAPGLRYLRLRAPAQDGASLVVPPFSCVGRMLSANQTLRSAEDCTLLGRSLKEITADARSEVLAAAVKYTSSYRSVPAHFRTATTNRIIAAGHQPELFHPGVWFKNFALSDLARIHQAIALNLVIDTDDAKAAAINVPGGTVDHPQLRQIAFDDASPATVPFEERSILNLNRFERFAKAAAEHLRPLVADPLLEEFWPTAITRARATNNLGAALAQARHLLEEQFGLNSLELPQSHVCETESFRWFAGHLICKAAQFAEDHNEALRRYRQVNHVRSHAHPVPNLEQIDGWTETPFWIWSSAEPNRRSLYVQCTGKEIVLSDRAGLEKRIPACEGEQLVHALRELSERGFKFRTKALATTMWARLALSDLFLHGIGGAKYDQLNNEIIRRHFGLQPPSFLTVTATFRLPILGLDELADENALRATEQQLRELEFQPERHIDSQLAARDNIRALIEEKQRLIAQEVPRGLQSKQRFDSLSQINKELQQFVATSREKLTQSLFELRPAVRMNEMLRGREFSFCLFPLDKIRRFMLEIRPDEP